VPPSHALRPLLQVSCAASVLLLPLTALRRKKASVRATYRAPDSKQRSRESQQPYKCGALVKERRKLTPALKTGLTAFCARREYAPQRYSATTTE
jgi:hypothetical protein